MLLNATIMQYVNVQKWPNATLYADVKWFMWYAMWCFCYVKIGVEICEFWKKC